MLLNTRHRYVDSEIITQQVDLTLRQEFQGLSGNPDDDEATKNGLMSMSLAILELANLIGNITNALNFELKNAQLKNNQIKDLEA